jgi:hypothetical protein
VALYIWGAFFNLHGLNDRALCYFKLAEFYALSEFVRFGSKHVESRECRSIYGCREPRLPLFICIFIYTGAVSDFVYSHDTNVAICLL